MTDKHLNSVYNGNSKELEAPLKFYLESNRKETFKSWVFTENKKCNASKLAEAGFHFIGSPNEPDAVQCIFCLKSLDGWEENDDPWQEHQNHSPDCKFAKLGKPECKLTGYEYTDLLMEIPAVWARKLYENKKAEIINRQKILKKMLKS